jgi:hypothetical protein
MINWQYFPKSDKAPGLAKLIVQSFEAVAGEIDSANNDFPSNEVLRHVAPHLQAAGFKVEMGKGAAEKICVPVLFGGNGRIEKSFHADAFYEAEGFVVEVEAGRGVVNNQFLKDLFQACMMQDVYYLAIAVRNVYRNMRNYETVLRFFDTLYASNRLQLPLKGVLIVGY